MITLTADAQQRLDQYLGQVRAALSGCRSVSADEVERDVREHIENEFHSATEPVPLAALEAVLGRLGSPSQWVPAVELPGWYRILLHFRDGPEDWRLAYLSFGLLLAGVLTGLVYPSLVALVLLVASFLVARAALAVARGRGEELGAQRWLLYPSLLLVYPGLLAVLLLWPLWSAAPGGIEANYRGYAWLEYSPGHGVIPSEWLVLRCAALGLWWLFLGVVLWRRPRWFAALFYPVVGGLLRRAPLVLSFAGLALVVLCVGVVVRVLTNGALC